MKTGDPLLILDGLVFGYPRKPLNNGKPVSLRFNEGFRLGLWGPNGCGKSTFLKTILGLLPSLNGTATWSHQPRIGFVPQDLILSELLPITVQEVLLSLAHSKESLSEITKFLEIDQILNLPWRELSRGQRQRTLLGRALMRSPQVLILDEPYSALDQNIVEKLILSLEERDKGLSLMVIDHHEERLRRVVDEILEFTNEGMKRVSA